MIGPNRSLHLAFLSLTGLMLLALGGCSSSDSGSNQAGAPTQVVAIDARSSPVRESMSLVGTLEANETVEILSETEGPIETIHFEAGDTVTRDQLLVELERDKLEAREQQARADFRLSEISYRRNKKLFADSLISQQEFDQAQLTYEARQADLRLRQEELEDTRIRAPFAGRVTERRVSPGQVVTKSQSLTTLVDLTPIKLAVDVPERFLGELALDQTVNLGIAAYPTTTFEGKVYFISPAVDRSTRTALVKARIPNPNERLRPGMFGNVTLTTKIRESAVVIPEAAIMRDADATSVFVVTPDNTAEKRTVTLGVRFEGGVEVREGLSAGETVIVEGIQKVRIGGPVKQAPAKEAEPYLKWLEQPQLGSKSRQANASHELDSTDREAEQAAPPAL